MPIFRWRNYRGALALVVLFATGSFASVPPAPAEGGVASDRVPGYVETLDLTRAVYTPDTVQPVLEEIDLVEAEPFSGAYRDGVSLGRAVDCLTQAIYYEGALEPDVGQGAIAQVVLNRVSHPSFPNTICGVVYEGAHLSTGCQFTFTCDGSLARQPSARGWARARRTAEKALAGEVSSEAGLATHYHAQYVDPYWSSSLNRIDQIGAHIFYIWKGRAGRPEAFAMAYGGYEPDSTAYEDAARTAESATEIEADGEVSDITPELAEERSEEGDRKVPFRPRPLRLAD